MKLTKKLEAEVLKVYNACWEAYLRGDLKTHGFHLSPEFHFVGTSEGEQFNSKKEWIAYCKKTLRQFAGVIQKKTRNISLAPAGEGVMVTENSDIYVLIENKWTFYSKIRITALLQKEDGLWKYIHQHGSIPDARANEGEVIATEQIKKENLQLREAVKRRTAELEHKNRELEIEAALERTRTQSMLMQYSDEILNVSSVFHEQLVLLGIQTEFSYVWLPDEAKQEHQFWATWAEQENGTTISKSKAVTYPLDKTEPYTAKCFAAWQSNEPIYIEHIPPPDVKNYFSTWEELLRDAQKMKAEFFPEGLYYTEAYIKYGCFGINIRRLLSEDEQQILRRFTVEFERTYTRFLDLKKAEAQAREAKIETGLERVRGRTMAMHKSGELLDVIKVIAEQLIQLNLKFDNVSFGINDQRDDFRFWLYSSGQPYPCEIQVPYIDNAAPNRTIEAQKKGIKFFSDVLTPDENKQWVMHLIDHSTVINSFSDKVKTYLLNSPGFARSTFILKDINLYIGNYSASPYTPEENKVIKRFAQVFEQSYTRFLDLQKAEAQAREAKIEAALERVRSRTMGMQKSEELKEVIQVVFEQFIHLNINVEHTGFVMDYRARDDYNIWVADPLGVPSEVTIPYFDSVYYNSFNEAKEKGIDFFATNLSFEEKNKFYYKLFDYVPGLPEESKKFYFSCPGLAASTVLLENIGLYIENFSGIPYSDEDNTTLMRFGKVFQQTYTRFLDLQKAEAQAREAQIEAALERVRSRTMGMQQSHELGDVATVLFKELNHLVENLWTCGFVLCEKDRGEDEWWLSTGDGFIPAFYLPNTGDPTHANIYDAWKNGETYHTEQLEGEALQEHYDWLMNIPVSKNIFDDMKAAGNSLPSWQKLHCAYFSFGYLVMITQVPCPEEQVFKRFAQVFDQTYTRFLDLQKAEAQAREAKIEAALEKIRGRSLGMHRSDELKDVVAILYEKLKDLGLSFDGGAGIHLFKEDSKDAVIMVASPVVTYPIQVNLPYDEDEFINNPIILDVWQAKETGQHILNKLYPFEEKNRYFNYVFKHNDLSVVPAIARETLLRSDSYTATFIAEKNSMLGASSWTGQLFSDDEVDVLKRIARVFEQAYIRFLDLQKAEAQTREAQIEIAVERVRAKALAMHKSAEILSVAASLREEMVKLNLQGVTAATIFLEQANSNYRVWDLTEINETEDGARIKLDIEFNPETIDPDLFFLKFLRSKEKYLIVETNKADYERWADWYRNYDAAGADKFLQYLQTNSNTQLWHAAVPLERGSLKVDFMNPPPQEMEIILPKMAGAFDLAYRRFLDIQKAEAQAKEAEIELALERVRSRAMAMHSSQELKDVATELRNQMSILGQTDMEICAIHLYDESPDYFESIAAGPVFDPILKVIQIQVQVKLPKHGIQIIEEMMNQYYSGKKDYVLVNHGEKGVEWFELLREKVPLAYEFVMQNLKGTPLEELIIYWSVSDFKGGSLVMTTYVPPGDEARKILRRFANVFGLAYQRFKDLKLAEAQAKEAKIEAALERVRSRTMGMQKSEELKEVIQVVYEQFLHLNIHIEHTGFIMDYKARDDMHIWLADQHKVPSQVTIPYFDCAHWNSFNEAKAKGINFFANHLSFEEKNRFYQDLFKLIPGVPEQTLEYYFSCPGLAISTVLLDNVGLYIENFSGISYSNEENATLMRFGKVFQQTYTRFLDLQKAEAQAREATIEAALERVRGKAMAMHSSGNLAETIGVFYRELRSLSATPRRCGVALMDNETGMAEITTMNTTDEGDSIEIMGKLKMAGHPVLDGILAHWVIQKEYHPVLRGAEVKEYYDVMRPQVAFPDYPTDSIQFGYYYMFDEGWVYAWTEKELSEDELKIYRRFTSVLSLTYKRYKDLKDAEARAQIAVKDAALDRIRADIASMRTTNDLERITPLIWNELIILGIPFIRCGVFIMDEAQQLIHTFLSTPDGKAIGAFHLPYDTPGNISQVIRHWRDNQNYIAHWDESAFTELAGMLVKQGAIPSTEQYLSTIPHGGFHLHFLPFLQGMLYVGNTTRLSEDEIKLIQSVADAFSTAYARYEDFNKLEAAKEQVDKMLVDLKQAQTQLVQSEKMASLGELTAGIAHEIQNPLNFVNNFSDVSNELLEEMKDELSTGNMQQAIEIAENVKQNLEKILHHGKRADAIVKGMLQHSRTSSGQKEPTDVNVLADEYLRLAYHGLRAKDKSFNARFETDFDPTVEKINVVPQEIGRVILNLINNAFYAVSEKKKYTSASLSAEQAGSAGQPYEPVVTVSTRKANGKVSISVIDNGIGIPQKALDKIFQPFFTTKPTSQGTGLGLSLAYDIVTKGHGGELKVETKEGEGSEFIVSLPG